MTDEQWQRVDQIRELVKQEGDARCEAALDDLVGEVVRYRTALEQIIEEGEPYTDEDNNTVTPYRYGGAYVRTLARKALARRPTAPPKDAR